MELLVLLGLVAVGFTLSSLVDFSSDEDADPITRTDGTEGDDTIIGGEGRDLLIGAAGADSLDGGAGDDQLEGGFGDDLLQGGAGDDALLAARGEDTLLGGDGSDFLYGGVGDDSLSGDAGEDLSTGQIDRMWSDLGLDRATLQRLENLIGDGTIEFSPEGFFGCSLLFQRHDGVTLKQFVVLEQGVVFKHAHQFVFIHSLTFGHFNKIHDGAGRQLGSFGGAMLVRIQAVQQRLLKQLAEIEGWVDTVGIVLIHIGAQGF